MFSLARETIAERQFRYWVGSAARGAGLLE